jgi:hypothetical protein
VGANDYQSLKTLNKNGGKMKKGTIRKDDALQSQTAIWV